jgi:ABC-2 type transport system permease protein
MLPSVNAIDGIVRINQMGASLTEVRPDWLRLWALSALYFAVAVVLSQLRTPRVLSDDPAV